MCSTCMESARIGRVRGKTELLSDFFYIQSVPLLVLYNRDGRGAVIAVLVKTFKDDEASTIRGFGNEKTLKTGLMYCI